MIWLESYFSACVLKLHLYDNHTDLTQFVFLFGVALVTRKELIGIWEFSKL